MPGTLKEQTRQSMIDDLSFPDIICNSRLCHKALGLLHNSLWQGHDEPPKSLSSIRVSALSDIQGKVDRAIGLQFGFSSRLIKREVWDKTQKICKEPVMK